ncbi:MAG: GTPase HflX [Chitinispirillaceae bacterium]|nr:GTPase HflX [Chitinispirillaceae bacterium]
MTARSGEKVVLAGLFTADSDDALFAEDMHEMRLLCSTAGALVVATVTQKHDKPVASTFMGPGKLQEIKKLMDDEGAGTLVIDGALSPGQVRNIEKIVERKVIDRAQLILDIFAQHARTSEARVQVELAQMRRLSPRLTHAYSGMSQQAGGIGTLGPGEKKLEIDRRVVRKRITDLEKQLDKIEKARIEQRKSRQGSFMASLVGYTNAGKSSLLNALCGSSVPAENRLFATLDTATRRSYIQGAGPLVISDTVGFLRKLPHDLVASFRSTLAVAAESNLLIWVMDSSSAWIDQQYATVSDVLAELGAAHIPSLLVFNKSDKLKDSAIRDSIRRRYPGAIFVSAFSKPDMEVLKVCIGKAVLDFGRAKTEAQLIHRETQASHGLSNENSDTYTA